MTTERARAPPCCGLPHVGRPDEAEELVIEVALFVLADALGVDPLLQTEQLHAALRTTGAAAGRTRRPTGR
jgi:hypothetical protein